jgi:RimJ/RimL family protein N-acetyltransferase
VKLNAVPLHNDWVGLELLQEAHRPVLKPLANDPTMWVQTTLNASGDGFDAWFDSMMASCAAARQISYAVLDRVNDVIVGHTSLLSIAEEHDRVEIGWTWYAPFAHRTHVNPAAKSLLFAHAFACGAKRVELKTGSQNLRSQGAMEKMGAVREGVLRSHTVTWTGERRDSVFFSVLVDEWPKVRENLEARLEGFAQ